MAETGSRTSMPPACIESEKANTTILDLRCEAFLSTDFTPHITAPLRATPSVVHSGQ